VNVIGDDKPLRKAWLKRKFGSHEYHEELLRLHQRWYELIRQALSRPEVARDYPELYKFFRETAFRNFDRAPKPEQWTAEFYQAHRASGAYRGIADYGQLMYPNYWEWMTDAECEATNALWMQMSQISENIRRTVDDTWAKNDENILLSERYTGPICWPPNWQTEVANESAISGADDTPARSAAGNPVSRSGYWFTPAKQNSRRYFKRGDVFPEIEGSAYGATFWQWATDQSDPKL